MSGMYPVEQKISIYGKEVSWPGLKDGKFTSGDFNDPLVPPSFIPAETQNLILDNLGNLVASMGGVPDNTGIMQLANLFTSDPVANKGVKRDLSGYTQITTAPSSDNSNKAASTQFVVNFIRDQIIPINKAIYVQYPGLPTPTDFYAGLGITTWTKVFSGGYFFRTDGGNALPFNGGWQDSKNRLHGHNGATASMNRNSSHQHGGVTGSMNRSWSHTHQTSTYTSIKVQANTGGIRIGSGGAVAEDGSLLHTDTNHEHGFATDWRNTNHEHAFSTSQEGGNEANPINQTYIIWKRTA